MPKERVYTIPCRFVRTMKSDEANSRLVIPGHMDLGKAKLGRAKAKDGGELHDRVRTDAPVAPQLVLHLILSVAANLNFELGSFDIGSAGSSSRTTAGMTGIPYIVLPDRILCIVLSIFLDLNRFISTIKESLKSLDQLELKSSAVLKAASSIRPSRHHACGTAPGWQRIRPCSFRRRR